MAASRRRPPNPGEQPHLTRVPPGSRNHGPWSWCGARAQTELAKSLRRISELETELAATKRAHGLLKEMVPQKGGSKPRRRGCPSKRFASSASASARVRPFELIAERANVSVTTFFRYFQSKRSYARCRLLDGSVRVRRASS